MPNKNILIPAEVQSLLDAKAPVCIGLSGGKDSTAVAWAVSQALLDYQGPKLLIHADLGTTEWEDSWPSCQRIAERIGWELVSCRRPAGDMMDRWESRWQSSVRRYANMETVTVVLPWSTPAMRFCQSELKVAPITSLIKRRFGKVPVLNVTGVRGEESTTRAKQPACAPIPTLPPRSLAWRPIHHWELPDVWTAIAESGIPPHEAYGTYGSSRVSCRFCILANEADLRASLKDPAAAAIYVRMCELELSTGFAFQGSRWLTSLATDLVPEGESRLKSSQWLQKTRAELQAWIPKHLQFTRGWPHCVPSIEESERLAAMRTRICFHYGWTSPYLTAETVRARYQELWDIKQAKAA
jgi:3'-phosphoadenosine 5'-phosphosulfate sulfotransferase (PAPS reductase)/FAD synthetase